MTLVTIAHAADIDLDTLLPTAIQAGLRIDKSADPTEGYREGLTIREAREIASEDASLLWIEGEHTYESILALWADRGIAGHVATAAKLLGLDSDDIEGRREIVREIRDEVNGLNDWSGATGGDLSAAEREAVVAAARRWLKATRDQLRATAALLRTDPEEVTLTDEQIGEAMRAGDAIAREWQPLVEWLDKHVSPEDWGRLVGSQTRVEFAALALDKGQTIEEAWTAYAKWAETNL